MKIFFIKRVTSVMLAIIIAITVSYFYAKAEKFWIPIATLCVMQTAIGSSLRQGLIRFFSLALLVAIGTVIYSFIYPPLSLELLFGRLYDIGLGALIGIVINLVVFPRAADIEFRNNMIPILEAYGDYLIAIEKLLLRIEGSPIEAEQAKQQTEKMLLRFSPIWIYARGFSVDMRQGYRYFLVMTDRVEQILFSLHHIARHPFEKLFLQDMYASLTSYTDNANKIIRALIRVLELKKMTESLDDLSEEIQTLEKEFQTATPVSLELLEMSKDYIYFAALIADLKDLRATLLGLTQTLRE